MIESLSSKQGAWVKPGNKASGSYPGSYGDYVYVRSPPKDYQKTAQQKKISQTGRLVADNCKGKKGADFHACVADQYKQA